MIQLDEPNPEPCDACANKWCIVGSIVSEAIVRSPDFSACASIKRGVVRRWDWPNLVIGNEGGEIFLNLSETRLSTDNSREDTVQFDGFLLQSSMAIILRLTLNNDVQTTAH